MEEKTLKILEFDKVIERLSGFATSEVGRELCLKLKPSANARHIAMWQKNTSDALTRMRLSGTHLSFRSLRRMDDIIARLGIGAALSAAELLKVSAVLTVSDRAKSFDTYDEANADSLSESFELIEPLTSINRSITSVIIDEETIADDASPELMSIRRRIKKAESDIHDTMNARLNTYRDYLTDAVITMRDGRYCLPVKAEHKAKVAGIVHDTSSTGFTLFIEPMAVVNLNNAIKDLMAEEKKEIERILAELSLRLVPYAGVIKDNIKLLTKLDMIFAKALYSQDIDGVEPGFSRDRSMELKEARHPLIAHDKVVPISLRLGSDFTLLIVTGPNTGGKTVSLKTAGLLTLMAQAGLHIPAADGSVMGIYDNVYADIGDEQSIEQSLSTFSSHMTNTVHILNEADSRSLCLFDELGSGTDPTEGAALGMAILDFLHNMKTNTMATTHYAELKAYAIETPGVENACCEFDVETLKPTYRLLIGVPGKSNAFAISERLGLPSYIIDDAKKRIDSENESLEGVIKKLNDDRIGAEKAREEAEKYKAEAEELRRRLKAREERLETNRDKIINDARLEAQRILKEAKKTADTAIKNINNLKSVEDYNKAEAERERIRKNLRESSAGAPMLGEKGPSKPVSPKKLKVGDIVRVMSMGGVNATVLNLPDKDNIIKVQIGFMQSRVSVKDVEMADGVGAWSGPGAGSAGSGTAGRNASGTGGGRSAGGTLGTGSGSGMGLDAGFGLNSGSGVKRSAFSPKALSISPEINLIGMTTDEARPVLEKYLDDAYLSHIDQVRIVHGRGTGALKNMVHERLKRTKYVDSYRLGVFGEGDTGVTIVYFKK